MPFLFVKSLFSTVLTLESLKALNTVLALTSIVSSRKGEVERVGAVVDGGV